MIEIEDKSLCCGCTACESICGVNAIKIITDLHGFKYPEVNQELCVNCGLCNKVCSFNLKPQRNQSFTQKYYGCRLKSDSELAKSQSGGAFKAIGDWAIKNKYMVYGVTLNERLEAIHTSASTKEEINRFRGSKYVQSNIDGVYKEICFLLKKGQKILFTGTGCQVSGLISLCKLKKIDTTNLITVDLICYGVPSPQYWKDYLVEAEKKHNSKVIKANFRDKEVGGWSGSQNSLTLENGSKIYPKQNFYHPVLFRKSCSRCPFTSFERTSDITIGDFWGIEKIHPEYLNDNKGISLMLINSKTGNDIFEQIKDQFEYFETSKEDCRQQQLSHPNPIHPQKEIWEKYYETFGYAKAIKKLNLYSHPSILRSYLGKFKHCLKKAIK